MWLPSWVLQDLAIILLCHWIWVISKSCCTTLPFHPPIVVLVFVILVFFLTPLNGFCIVYNTCHGGTWYGFVSSLTCSQESAFESPNSGKYIAIFLVYFLCCFCTCLSIDFCAWPCNKKMSISLLDLVLVCRLILVLLIALTYLAFVSLLILHSIVHIICHLAVYAQ